MNHLTDNDPLFTYHQWTANLRILEVDELKSVPYMPVLVQRMFMSTNRVVDPGIYCSYCILRHRILTELFFGGHDAQQSAASADPSSQGLAGLRSVGGTPCDLTGPLRHCIRARLGRR